MIPNNVVALKKCYPAYGLYYKNYKIIFIVVMVVWPVTTFMYGPIKRLEEHLVDALVQRGDEGRDTLR